MTTFWRPVHFDMFQPILIFNFVWSFGRVIHRVSHGVGLSVSYGVGHGESLGVGLYMSWVHDVSPRIAHLTDPAYISLCGVCSLKYVSSCMLQMLSMRVQRHLHCALSSKEIQCNMQSLTSEPLALCETHRLRCSITINIKTLISYCTISNLFKNRQQLNNLILAFSIFFPKTHICHSFHSWPSHFFQKRLSTFSFHRLHRCWEVMTLNIDCHHHDHHRHDHQNAF